MATSDPPTERTRFLAGRSLETAPDGARAGGTRLEVPTLAAVLDAVPDFILLIDCERRVVAANEAVARHFGTTPEALTRPDGHSLIPAEAMALRASQVETAFATGEPQVFEVERQGRIYEDRIFPVDGDDGRPALLACYARDVTERRRAEDALGRYAGMVDTSPEMMAIVDLDGRYILVNEAYLTAHGRRREETIGRRVADVLAERVYAERVRPSLDRAFAGEASRWEGWQDFAGTGRRYTDASYHPYYDANGEISGAVVSVRDLTELQGAREKLLANERRLVHALESAKAGAWEWDITSGTAIWTDSQYRLLDWEPGEVEATYERWMTRVHPDHVQSVETTVRHAIETAGDLDFECRVQLPRRGERWIRTLGRAFCEEEGQVVELYGLQIDVTERKRDEQERERLLADLRALSSRLSAVEEEERLKLSRELHDQVGQTMAALSLTLGLVQTQLPPGSPLGRKITESMTLVEETSARIRDVVADLRPPVLDEYGLRSALDWLADWVSARTELEVVVEGEEFSPRLASTAELSLFRIAQEALTNTVRHAGATRAEITLTATQGQVEMRIADDGVGFDLSDELEPSESRHWGLMSMRERAAAIGGQLDVDSSPGEGTRVRVRLAR